MSLKNDRMRNAKVILPKGTNTRGMNMSRVDVSGRDTMDRSLLNPKYKVHRGKRGGVFVLIGRKKRYLRG